MNRSEAQEINSSSLWETVCKEIDENKIRPLELKFRHCKPEEFAGIQLAIKVWEEAKRLPRDAAERDE